MTEYIVIVGLVAVLLVTAVVGLRRSMGSAFGAATSAIEQVGLSVAAPTLGSDDTVTPRSIGGNARLVDEGLVDQDGDGIDDRTQR